MQDTLKSKRNLGIDLLRILSMVSIVILHINGNGGLLGSTEAESVKNGVVWFSEVAFYWPVNVYAMVSGFVNHKRAKYSNLVYTWLEVLFYSVGIALLFRLVFPEMYYASAGSEFWTFLFPIMSKKYWFMTAYFGMFLFVPLINKGVEGISEKQLRTVVITMFLAFSLVSSVVKLSGGLNGIQAFDLDGLVNGWREDGYSVWWLLIMYIFGAYLGKFRYSDKKEKPMYFVKWGCLFILVTVIGWEFKFLCSKYGLPQYEYFLLSYISPVTVIQSVSLVMIFMKLNIGEKAGKVLSFISPLSLGCYLIHVHPCIWKGALAGKFEWIANYPVYIIPILILGCALGVFALCTVFDCLRFWLFKLLHIKELCRKIFDRQV